METIMERPVTPIAADLYDRLFYLADPSTVWVRGNPAQGQSCLLYDCPLVRYSGLLALIDPAQIFIEQFIEADFKSETHGVFFWVSIARWNDYVATSKEEVLWLLEDALDEAIEGGL